MKYVTELLVLPSQLLAIDISLNSKSNFRVLYKASDAIFTIVKKSQVPWLLDEIFGFIQEIGGKFQTKRSGFSAGFYSKVSFFSAKQSIFAGLKGGGGGSLPLDMGEK